MTSHAYSLNLPLYVLQIPCGVACFFALFLYISIEIITVERPKKNTATDKCYETIQTGAKASVCAGLILVYAIIIWVLTSRMPNLDTKTRKDMQFIWQYQVGGLTTASFFGGAFTSMFCSYLSMKVAVSTNAKVAIAALEEGPKGWVGAFNCAFHGGAVTGFVSCGIAIAVLSGAHQIY